MGRRREKTSGAAPHVPAGRTIWRRIGPCEHHARSPPSCRRRSSSPRAPPRHPRHRRPRSLRPRRRPSPRPSAPPTASPVDWLACMVSDTGGIDDHAFNENAWKGMLDAQAKLGIQVKFLESQRRLRLREEHQPVPERRLQDDRDRRLPARRRDEGRGRGQSERPLRDRRLRLRSGDPERRRPGLLDERGRHARRLRVGVVVEDPRPGHVRRDQHRRPRDRLHGRSRRRRPLLRQGERAPTTTVLGWDPVTKTGSFTGDFSSIDNGKTLSLGFLDENADVILGVGGPIGQGIFAAIEERGVTAVGLGVDVDWYVSVPQYKSLILTSILKKIDVSVDGGRRACLQRRARRRRSSSARSRTAASISVRSTTTTRRSRPTRRPRSKTLKAKIISGEVKVADYFAAP